MILLFLFIAVAASIPIVGTLVTDAPWLWPVFNTALLLVVAIYLRLSSRHLILRLTLLAIVLAINLINHFYLTAYLLQNSGFNDAFFYHLRPDLLTAGWHAYWLPLMLASMQWLALLFLAARLLAKQMKPMKKRVHTGLWLLLILFATLTPPVSEFVHYQSRTLLANYWTSDEASALIEQAQVPFSINADAAKPNLVIVYLESLEQTFLDNDLFPGLTPNL